MNITDVIFWIINVLWMIKGAVKGFLKEFLGLVILVGVFLGVFLMFPWIVDYLGLDHTQLSAFWLSLLFICLFIPLYIVGRLLQWLLVKALVFQNSLLERLLGALVGSIKVFLLACLLVFVINYFGIPEQFPAINLKDSQVYLWLSELTQQGATMWQEQDLALPELP